MTYINLEPILNVYNRNGRRVNNVKKINRFGIAYPDEELAGSRGYIFMMRPDLNLFSSEALKFPEFKQAYHDYRDVMSMLTKSADIESPFINIITSKAENFNTQDVTIESEKFGETFSGFKSEYVKFSTDSTNGGEFSIKYTDNRYLEVYRLHHLWMEYMRYVTRGKISPKKVYIHNHELDYATTLYYFLVAEDGGTILYANKYTGVFPTNTPDSSFSYSMGDDTRLSYDITYKWVFSDNYRYINIFQEFNNRTRANRGSKVPVFNTKTNTVTNTWVRNAYIELDRASRNYMLRFTN